ncbi:GGDEF domain-containing protein [Hydrogenovibrio sp. 3SP14C1]|uniref:diguanylate cyclase n=1 Tax=Hydrogenovibrio sp. 3SP14C1 TaxID=3038774 RepID=UPI002415D23A|nr:diguanylate cyclase [Hydrogenovibrio sp. 3SP14C1]MDG4813481.1 GGDEF domain-containing protein [Hydrogenovibrio sp. 3SP14C1]
MTSIKGVFFKTDYRFIFLIPVYFLTVAVFAAVATFNQEWPIFSVLSVFALAIFLFGIYLFKKGLTFFGKAAMLVVNTMFVIFLVVYGGHNHTGYFWVFPILVATIQVLGAASGVFFACLLVLLVWLLDKWGMTDTVLSSRFYFASLGLVFITGVHELTLERHRKALRKQVDVKDQENRLDPLTKVGNRRLIDQELSRMSAQGMDGLAVGALIVDLDNFKKVNDTLGHSAGDEVLKTIANHLSSCVRPSDKVARWGGDEFMILLFGISLADAEMVAKRIQESIINDDRLNSLDVSVSMGGAITLSDYSDLFKEADKNLLSIKNHSKNSFKITMF